MAHTLRLQSALETGQRLELFRSTSMPLLPGSTIRGFIFFKLCSGEVENSVLSVLTQFISNRSQNVVVDGCRSKLVVVVSAVLQGSVLGLQLFPLYTSKLFSKVKRKLYEYADDSTLVAVVPSEGQRVDVTESLNRDLHRVSIWCDLC